MNIIKHLKSKIKEHTIYSKDKSDAHGEVFTPESLIIEMCSSLPEETWSNSNIKILDPCSGKGNFPIIIIQGLMKGLKTQIPDAYERYKHIVEKQLYMCEFQKESAQTINDIFNIEGVFKLNLFVGDTLTMPEDFFDLSFEERKIKYPNNCI